MGHNRRHLQRSPFKLTVTALLQYVYQ